MAVNNNVEIVHDNNDKADDNSNNDKVDDNNDEAGEITVR